MGDHDLAIVSNIIIFVSSLSFLASKLPVAYQFITMFNFLIFGATTIGVAGACIITTGLPCVIALGLSAIINLLGALLSTLGINASNIPLLQSFISSSPYAWIGSLILTPISLILQVFISKLARGQ